MEEEKAPGTAEVLKDEWLEGVSGGFDGPIISNNRYYIYKIDVASQYTPVAGPYNSKDEAKAVLDAMIRSDPNLMGKIGIHYGFIDP